MSHSSYFASGAGSISSVLHEHILKAAVKIIAKSESMRGFVVEVTQILEVPVNTFICHGLPCTIKEV